MAIRMSHPEHGVTHAVGAEVAWNKANGWKIDPEPVYVAPVEPEAKAEEPEKRKPGRPPTK